jgi:tetratricopeptide (TPR) repeat protein
VSSPTASALALCVLLVACRPTTGRITQPPTTIDVRPPGPSPAARSAYIAAHLYLAEERWDEATAAFTEARKRDPDSPAILRGLAAAAEGRGEIEARDRYLKRAAALEAEEKEEEQ